MADKEKFFTEGERAVWVAAYAASFEIDTRSCERDRAYHAVGAAQYAVGALRLYVSEEDSPRHNHYEEVCEILGIEPRECIEEDED